MTSKLIEKTVVLPKKDRITESVNASPEDIGKLFKMKFLVKLAFHFEKKLFNKDEAFITAARDLYEKTMKSLKCEYGYDNFSEFSDPFIYTIDDIPIELTSVVQSKAKNIPEVREAQDELEKLCFQYGHVQMNYLEKTLNDWWLYGNKRT